MNKTKLTLYENLQDTKGEYITLEDYILRIKSGPQIIDVMEARKHEHGTPRYNEIKSSLPLVMGSAEMTLGKPKHATNIKKLNGLLFLDLDENIEANQIERIKADKHTLVMHESVGGSPRHAVVIKINPERFEDSFLTAQDYYYTRFGVSIDASCKNKNRLRYLSYDLNPFINKNAILLRARSIKKFEPPKKNLTNYIFSEDDFENIMRQIQDREINLTNDAYEIYVMIGMSLAAEFGDAGFDYFDAICKPSSKYNYKRGQRDYKGFVANQDGRISIGTFYYLCKQENIELYSKRTISIINAVKIGKAKGKPTISSIDRQITAVTGEGLTHHEIELTDKLIESKEDFSKLANEGRTDIEVLMSFINDMFNPYRCTISGNIYLENGTYVDDKIINNIYIACQINLPDLRNVNLREVRTILGSDKVREVNLLMDVINSYKDSKPTGYIEKYINAIPADTPELKEYNHWAFKRWIVGAVHNWTRGENNLLISPQTLVLTGANHGLGKTSFFEFILPENLMSRFFATSTISDNKDSMKRMCTHLILVDEEFSGDAVDNPKKFKRIVDTKIVTERFAYGYVDARIERRCIWGGSSNEIDILRDETGNRRILPINVNSRIDYDFLLDFPSEIMIAEAYNLLKDGFDWVIRTSEDMSYIFDMCKQNMETDPVEELFFNYFKTKKEDLYFKRVVMNQGEIVKFLHDRSNYRPSSSDLKRVYTRNKLEYKTHNMGGRSKKGFELWSEHFDGIEKYQTEMEVENDNKMPF